MRSPANRRQIRAARGVSWARARRPAERRRRRLAAARRIAATSSPLSTASRMHGTTLKKTPNSQKLTAVE